MHTHRRKKVDHKGNNQPNVEPGKVERWVQEGKEKGIGSRAQAGRLITKKTKEGKIK